MMKMGRMMRTMMTMEMTMRYEKMITKIKDLLLYKIIKFFLMILNSARICLSKLATSLFKMEIWSLLMHAIYGQMMLSAFKKELMLFLLIRDSLMSWLDLREKLGLKIIKIYNAYLLELKVEISFGLEEVYSENKLLLLKILLEKIIMFSENLDSNSLIIELNCMLKINLFINVIVLYNGMKLDWEFFHKVLKIELHSKILYWMIVIKMKWKMKMMKIMESLDKEMMLMCLEIKFWWCMMMSKMK